jgi:hypothetical protein
MFEAMARIALSQLSEALARFALAVQWFHFTRPKPGFFD